MQEQVDETVKEKSNILVETENKNAIEEPHVCSHNCSHKSKKDAGLGEKEFRCLKRNKYEELSRSYTKSFLLQHKKYHNKVVEIKATTPAHACYLIGWKPNQVILLQEKEVEVVSENISHMSLL